MRPPAAVPALAALVVLAGCGGGDDDSAGGRNRERAGGTAAPVTPALCRGDLRARTLGRVEGAGPTELSGLVRSHRAPGVRWTHNDSGDRARIFALSARGRLLADIAVTGAQNTDWEDIAAGPRGLYLADTGDNDAQRSSVSAYVVPEPRLGSGSPPAATDPARRIELRYLDGAHDAEALLVDPADGTLVLVTKSFSGVAGIYAARPGSGRLRRIGRLALGFPQLVTAGDVSADGRTIALRTYDRAYLWRRRPGESLAAAMRRDACTPHADLAAEGQGEALALASDGHSFETVPEGERPTLRRYAP